VPSTVQIAYYFLLSASAGNDVVEQLLKLFFTKSGIYFLFRDNTGNINLIDVRRLVIV
jgi:hypothetical protein